MNKDKKQFCYTDLSAEYWISGDFRRRGDKEFYNLMKNKLDYFFVFCLIIKRVLKFNKIIMNKMLQATIISLWLSWNVYADNTNNLFDIVANWVTRALELKNNYPKIDRLREEHPYITFYSHKVDWRWIQKPFNNPLIWNSDKCLLEVDVMWEDWWFLPDDHVPNDLCVLYKWENTNGIERNLLVEFSNWNYKLIMDKVRASLPWRKVVEE